MTEDGNPLYSLLVCVCTNMNSDERVDVIIRQKAQIERREFAKVGRTLHKWLAKLNAEASTVEEMYHSIVSFQYTVCLTQ